MIPYKPVDNYRTRLNANTTFHLALAAELVYKDLPDNAPDTDSILSTLKLSDPRYSNVHGFSVDSDQAIIIEHIDYIILSFRGSDEPADWLENFQITRISAYQGRMHRGFVQSFREVWHWMEPIYKQCLRDNRRPVFITGHSKGAAMANVCAAMFSESHRQWPFMQLITFGCPRCFDFDTAAKFNSQFAARTHRFQNNTDLVTRLPQRVAGYAHVGSCKFIDETLQIQSDPGYWSKFCDIVRARFAELVTLKLNFLEDHAMPLYTEAVDKWDLND